MGPPPPSSSYPPASALTWQKAGLTLDLSTARPPPPHLVFHPPEPEPESEPTSPTGRTRTIRFHSRVRIASGRRSNSGSVAGDNRARSASRESRAATSASESDGESDSSSIIAPLRDSRQRNHMPPSPLPAAAAPPPPPPPPPPEQEQQQQTYVVLGPSYGWSEHTPLLPKRFLPHSPRARGPSKRYDSEAQLNAELARARAAAKRTEEDVRCSQMSNGWLSWQWWGWKIRREVCCCLLEDDDDDEHDYD